MQKSSCFHHPHYNRSAANTQRRCSRSSPSRIAGAPFQQHLKLASTSFFSDVSEKARAKPRSKTAATASPGEYKIQNSAEVDTLSNAKKEGIDFYDNVKKDWTKLAMTQGGLLSFYIALVVNVEAGISTAYGVAGSLMYIKLLQDYVDQLGSENSWAPLSKLAKEKARQKAVEKATETGGLEWMNTLSFGGVIDIYRQALLQKRLAVPVVGAALASVINTSPVPVNLELTYALLGFLIYKPAVLTWVYNNDVKPRIIRGFSEGEKEDNRPVIKDINDEDFTK